MQLMDRVNVATFQAEYPDCTWWDAVRAGEVSDPVLVDDMCPVAKGSR
jgi:hypothetical protein